MKQKLQRFGLETLKIKCEGNYSLLVDYNMSMASKQRHLVESFCIDLTESEQLESDFKLRFQTCKPV